MIAALLLLTLSQATPVRLVDPVAGTQLSLGSDRHPLVVRPPNASVDAFGINKTVADVPEMHLEFVYNINTALVTTTTANGGTVIADAGMAQLETSTNSAGSAQLNTRQNLKYASAQGILAKFSALFTTGVASSQQEIGFANATDGLLFGYVGAVFGLIHRRDGVDTFVAQTSWNVDRCDGTSAAKFTLVPTRGNVYSVQYQWLGFGTLNYYVTNPATGYSVLVHRIVRGNSASISLPSLTNPSLFLWARVINSGNTSNLMLRSASMAVLREGPDSDYGVRGSTANRKTTISTETNLFTLRNNTTFADLTNRIQVRLESLSVTGSTDATFRLVLNPTIGGTPSFADFDTDTSVVAIDTAGTTRTGGRVVMSFVVDGNNGQVVDLATRSFYLYPGDTLAVTASSITGTLVANASLNWLEE